jgi:site-specific recombinase XerD
VPDLQRQSQRARLEKSPWLFPSPNNPSQHISANAVQKALAAAKLKDIPAGAGAACLRHSFIVHLLQAGINVRTVQDMVGIKTWQHMERFIRLASLRLPKSPADFP